jgi:hypothetical protein
MPEAEALVAVRAEAAAPERSGVVIPPRLDRLGSSESPAIATAC